MSKQWHVCETILSLIEEDTTEGVVIRFIGISKSVDELKVAFEDKSGSAAALFRNSGELDLPDVINGDSGSEESVVTTAEEFQELFAEPEHVVLS